VVGGGVEPSPGRGRARESILAAWVDPPAIPPENVGVVRAVPIAGLWVAAPAWAAGSGGDGGLNLALALMAVVAAAFVVTNLLSEWVERRLGIVTGVEYIVLGAIAGPLTGWVGGDSAGGSWSGAALAPLLALGTGSLGLLTGLLVDLGSLRGRHGAFAAAIVISSVTLAVVAGLPTAGLAWAGRLDVARHLPPLVVVAAVALVADLVPLRSLSAWLDARGPATELALRVSRGCSSVAIVVFGVAFCLFRPADLVVGAPLGAGASFAAWAAVHLALGAVLGLVFTAFLTRDTEDDRILTVVIGMVVFTSGLAYYLRLSPVVVNFVLGIVLAGICAHSVQVRRMLQSVERPLYVLLFLFAGTRISLDLPWWAPVAPLTWLALRAVGRQLGGLLAHRLVPATRGQPVLGPVLWAPGALSAAMLLDFHQVFGGAVEASLVGFTLVVGIVISEAVAYRLARSWLIDASDIAVGAPSSERASGLGS
jgi:Kef-type K+ transport system membrane component KefB